MSQANFDRSLESTIPSPELLAPFGDCIALKKAYRLFQQTLNGSNGRSMPSERKSAATGTPRTKRAGRTPVADPPLPPGKPRAELIVHTNSPGLSLIDQNGQRVWSQP